MAEGSSEEDPEPAVESVPQVTDRARGGNTLPPLDVSSDPVVPKAKVETDPYDPEQARDNTRGRIAYWLLALVSLVVVYGMYRWGAYPYTDSSKLVSDLKELAAVFFNPLTTLLGTAIGFYFGSQGAQRPKGPKE